MQAVFTNTKDKWFKPGMFCRVNVNMQIKKDALVIPFCFDNTNKVILMAFI
jgi:hypothetical protein